MGHVETTTTQWSRRALTVVAPAHGVSAKPWLTPGANGFAIRRTAMHPMGTRRLPEAPT